MLNKPPRATKGGGQSSLILYDCCKQDSVAHTNVELLVIYHKICQVAEVIARKFDYEGDEDFRIYLNYIDLYKRIENCQYQGYLKSLTQTAHADFAQPDVILFQDYQFHINKTIIVDYILERLNVIISNDKPSNGDSSIKQQTTTSTGHTVATDEHHIRLEIFEEVFTFNGSSSDNNKPSTLICDKPEALHRYDIKHHRQHSVCEMILKDYIEKAHLDELMKTDETQQTDETSPTAATSAVTTKAPSFVSPADVGLNVSTVPISYSDVLEVITPHHVKAIETDFLKLMQSTHEPQAVKNVSPVSRHIRGPAAALQERQNISQQVDEPPHSHEQQPPPRNVEILAPIVATPRKSPRGTSPRASDRTQIATGGATAAAELSPEGTLRLRGGDNTTSPRYCSRPLLPAVRTANALQSATAVPPSDMLALLSESKDALLLTPLAKRTDDSTPPVTTDVQNSNKHPKDLERVSSVGSDQSTSSKNSGQLGAASPRDSLTCCDVTDDERSSSARTSFDRGSNTFVLPAITALTSPLAFSITPKQSLSVMVPVNELPEEKHLLSPVSRATENANNFFGSASLDGESGAAGGGYSLNAAAKHRNNSLNGGGAENTLLAGRRASPKNERTSPTAATSSHAVAAVDGNEAPKRNGSVAVLSPLSQVKAGRNGSFDFQQSSSSSSTPSITKAAATSTTSPEAAAATTSEGSLKLTTLVKVKMGTARARRRSIGDKSELNSNSNSKHGASFSSGSGAAAGTTPKTLTSTSLRRRSFTGETMARGASIVPEGLSVRPKPMPSPAAGADAYCIDDYAVTTIADKILLNRHQIVHG